MAGPSYRPAIFFRYITGRFGRRLARELSAGTTTVLSYLPHEPRKVVRRVRVIFSQSARRMEWRPWQGMPERPVDIAFQAACAACYEA